MVKYKKALFIFRRDLRLYDNTALIEALKTSEKVLCCFIFDPRQVSIKNNYLSINAIQYMLDSLKNLALQLAQKNGKLYFFSGIAEKIVDELIQKETIDAVFYNRDYTPFSIKRDSAIHKICIKNSISVYQFNDALLTQPEEILTESGTFYSKFTPFFKKAKKCIIAKPILCSSKNYYTKAVIKEQSFAIFKNILKTNNTQINIEGGRAAALTLLKNLKNFKQYEKNRNFPSIATTHLSAPNKFGTLSIREVYHSIKKQLGENHPLIQQLFWRDFFIHTAYNSPFVFGQAFQQKYNNLPWSTNKNHFNKWCKGETGFPIIDAGMRQLNTTGFMHNRVRMIVASFLVKDLHINWQWGEKYFAQQLEDYDPAVNNGNWQWCASTGCDAQPYFRIFNPWLQQKKFDPNCTYIKQWIPELKSLKTHDIHNLFKPSSPIIKNYPTPIVDHKTESKKAKQIFAFSIKKTNF